MENELIYMDTIEKKVIKLINKDYGTVYSIDGILCSRWEDGTYTIIKNIYTIAALSKYSKLRLTLNKVNNSFSFILTGHDNIDTNYLLNSKKYGAIFLNYIEDDFSLEHQRNNAIAKLYIDIVKLITKKETILNAIFLDDKKNYNILSGGAK